MLNCQWARDLTRYDCRPVRALDGSTALEIGTPFSLHDGSALVVYVLDQGSHVQITDNGDTLAQLSGMGLDVWHASRRKALRDRTAPYGLALGEAGDFFAVAQPSHAAFVFARAISGLLAVGDWAAEELRSPQMPERSLADEAEPYIVARNPEAKLQRRKLVKGASRAEYRFDFLHGADLIDVISPSAQATGGAMRKAGDVQNGPFAEGMSPLIVVDDRQLPIRAHQEISILGSVTRAMAFSRLMTVH